MYKEKKRISIGLNPELIERVKILSHKLNISETALLLMLVKIGISRNEILGAKILNIDALER